MRVNLTKEEFMHTYASQYYDPVKAHEYYERTKQLKGRTTSGMSDEQKKAWGYVKNEVATEKKQKTEEIEKSSNAEIAALTSQATAARERISAKLKAWLEKISDVTDSNRKALSDAVKRQKEEIYAEKKRKLDALPEIPRTASPEQKERMRESNDRERDAINAEAKDKISKITDAASERHDRISDQASDDRSNVGDNASQERKVVAENLKTAISSVRDKVKEIKTALNNSTEETLDKEYDNIMANIAGKPAKPAPTPKATKAKKGDDVTARQQFIADNLARLKTKS